MSSFAVPLSNGLLLGLALALVTACGDASAPRSLVFEGTISPNLKLRANASISTSRDSVFCRGFLLQHPTARSTGRDARFERLPGNRYRASIDFTGAPHGGFCDWSISMIGVGTEDIRDEYLSTMILALLRKTYPDEPEPPSTIQIRCREDKIAGSNLRCEEVRDHKVYERDYALDFRGDMRVKLNLTFDPQPWYPPEWDEDPRLRPQAWAPGQVWYPPEWEQDPSLRPPGWLPPSAPQKVP